MFDDERLEGRKEGRRRRRVGEKRIVSLADAVEEEVCVEELTSSDGSLSADEGEELKYTHRVFISGESGYSRVEYIEKLVSDG